MYHLTTAIVHVVGLGMSVALAACFPVVAHGPHVEKGLRLGMSGSLHVAQMMPVGDTVQSRVIPWPVFSPAVGYGFGDANPEGARLRVGSQASLWPPDRSTERPGSGAAAIALDHPRRRA